MSHRGKQAAQACHLTKIVPEVELLSYLSIKDENSTQTALKLSPVGYPVSRIWRRKKVL